MKTAYWTNTGKTAVYKGGQQVQPGETVELPAYLCSETEEANASEQRSVGEAASEGTPSFDAATFLDRNVKEIAAELPKLKVKQLEALKSAEAKADQPRSTVSAAIDARLLELATQPDTEQK